MPLTRLRIAGTDGRPAGRPRSTFEFGGSRFEFPARNVERRTPTDLVSILGGHNPA